ncbi:hypothetical protein HK098_007807 [Nowakowskiella sp. JEL0407]|nr:hypothetical protein HK098_007807 [Nowakowskiella sp. JEL0407]
MPKYSITSHSGAILSIINNQYLSLTSPALNETQQTGWTTAETNHLDEANLSAIPTHAIENKIKRDSNNLAHLTVIDPITFSQLQKAWKRGDIKVDSVNSEQIQVDEQKENVGADASNSKIDETDTCNDESSSSKKKVKKPKKKQSETPTPKIPSIPFEVWILSHFDADKLDDWTDLGLGTCTSSKDKSHRCWFKVIYHPSVSVARSAILSHLPNFTEQSLWFGHLTIGFIPKDVHDKFKTTEHLLPVTSASESHLDELSQICVEIAKHVTKYSTNSRTITAVLALSNHILNIQPENASALISRSHCYLVLGKVDEAIADAKILYSRQSLIGFLRYAAAMKVMGDTDALVRVCWKCIFKMESNEWVTNNKEGLRNTMIKHLRKVIEEHGEFAGRIDTQISDDVEKSSPNQLVVPEIERVDFCFEQDELKTLYFTTLDLIKRQLKYTGTDAVSTSPIRVYCHSFGGKEWYRLPRNFSSLVPFQLYGSSTPRRQEDITEFANVGLTTVITLTKEEPLPAGWFTDRIRNVFIPVENYKPTTINQTNKAIWEIYLAQIQGGSSLVHCGGGKGRAGTVLGCYLLRFGVAPIGSLCEKCEKFSGKGEVFVRSNECSDGEKCASAQPPVMSAESAIEMIRTMRSGSIETKEQETFVREYSSWVWKNCEIGLKANDLEPDVVANDEFEEETHLSCEGEDKLGSVVILVGLPGSGK